MNGPTKVFARRAPRADAVEIALLQEDFQGKRFAGQPLVFAPYEPGLITEPAIRLQWDEAQRLMDELWACGIRPAQSHGSAGQLAATEKHLADMQSITTKLLDQILTRGEAPNKFAGRLMTADGAKDVVR